MLEPGAQSPAPAAMVDAPLPVPPPAQGCLVPKGWWFTDPQAEGVGSRSQETHQILGSKGARILDPGSLVSLG